MRTFRTVLVVSLMVLSIASAAAAKDFEWLKDLNIQAQADPSGFKARLAARFKIGDAQITTVLSNVEKPADAYMVLRLGEMSGQPTDRVAEKYRTGKGQGWGNLAKSLGIKPGSPEFHALKRGHDLDGGGGKGHGKGKGKGKGKGRDKD
ncbi:MAG: hypothetical protein AABZ15_10165 [Nitrospirota bacterium]